MMNEAKEKETMEAPPPPYSKDAPATHVGASSAPRHVGTKAREPRLLHIYSEGFTRSTYRIYDSDKITTLYTLELHSWSKPNIIIYAGHADKSNSTHVLGASKHLVGSVSYPTFGDRAEIVVHGVASRAEDRGLLSSGHKYPSSFVRPGGKIVWKDEDAITRTKICLDETAPNSPPIARVRYKAFATSKVGTLELLREEVMQGPGIDELVVTLLGESDWNGSKQ